MAHILAAARNPARIDGSEVGQSLEWRTRASPCREGRAVDAFAPHWNDPVFTLEVCFEVFGQRGFHR
jgi:hypothetical protein